MELRFTPSSSSGTGGNFIEHYLENSEASSGFNEKGSRIELHQFTMNSIF